MSWNQTNANNLRLQRSALSTELPPLYNVCGNSRTRTYETEVIDLQSIAIATMRYSHLNKHFTILIFIFYSINMSKNYFIVLPVRLELTLFRRTHFIRVVAAPFTHSNILLKTKNPNFSVRVFQFYMFSTIVSTKLCTHTELRWFSKPFNNHDIIFTHCCFHNCNFVLLLFLYI